MFSGVRSLRNCCCNWSMRDTWSPDWLRFCGYNERSGDVLLNLVPPKSIQGVLVEDNQATIRILENGRSPTFRHADKTQRVNLSWLEEQFKRKWYRLVHGPSVLQAADILTKPFTNSEKWKFAVELLGHSHGKGSEKSAKSAVSSLPQVSQALPATPHKSTGGARSQSSHCGSLLLTRLEVE